MLSSGSVSATNKLSITNNAATSVTGNLTANAYTGVTLSGSTLTLTGAATFANNTSLTFDSLTGGTALQAKSASFAGTSVSGDSAITDWTRSSYTLLTTTDGISGTSTYTDNTTNRFLTDGAEDYAGIFTSSDGKSLAYGLKWNDITGNGYGTFDLKDGATVTLSVALADNTSTNTNDWDGKSLTKAGDGILLLTGDNTYTGMTTISAGTLQLGNGGTTGSVAGDITDNAALVFNRSNELTYGGVISGSGTAEQAGTGTTVLTGDNTYTGMTTISAGTLQLGNGGTTGFVAGDITNNAALVFNRSDTLTYGGDISGTGSLEQTGTGTLVLSGNNTYTGDTTVSAGTLQIGDGGSTGSVAGNIVNNAALAFNRGDTLTYDGDISGSGSVTQSGDGTTILTGNNTYTGDTTVSAGTLVFSQASLALKGDITVDAATTLGIDTTGSVSTEGALTLSDNASLSVNDTRSGSSLTGTFSAADITVGDGVNFNLSGISDSSALDKVLFSSDNTISSDFSSVSVGGFNGAVDYLTLNTRKSDDGKQYLATYSLSWTANNNLASGSFTLDGDSFTVGSALGDESGNDNWDGRSLTKAGEGTLILTGNNTYTGGTTVSAGTLQIGNGSTTGSVVGDIVNNAALAFKRSDTLTFGENISGSGSVTQSGSGTTILTGSNTYTGATTVSAGTLKTGVENTFASTSGVTVADNATLNLGGNSQTVNTLNNSGTVLINDSGVDALANVVTLYGDVTNSGTVVINNCSSCAGQTLAVDGDWTGDGGTVSIGTVLGGDDSLTDKLAISGAATGTTYVSVTNEDGAGAQTLEGIEVITTGSSTENAFVQSGRIIAGSYEYYLQQGTASGANTSNWYLTSIYDGSGGTTVYRPERGSYVSNLQAAGTMFNTRLKDRQGGGVYTDPVTGERYESSLWARAVGGHTEGRMSDGQSAYSANRMVFQLGGDVLSGSLLANDEWHLGVMGGYGKQYSQTRNHLSGYHSKGSVWGYSTGLYGTWYQNAQDHTGLYVDSWVLYNWFDNSVKGDELAYEKYKSKGLSASLESGYTFHVGSYLTTNGMENNVYVTPQAQVLWSGVKADNHTEANGTQVQGRGSDNLQTRLGVRLSMTGQSHLDKGSVRQFEPFVEANWVHTAKDYGVKMGDSSAYLQGSRNVAELKTGVEGRVSDNLSVWGNVAQQMGAHDYRDTQGMLGVKYAF